MRHTVAVLILAIGVTAAAALAPPVASAPGVGTVASSTPIASPSPIASPTVEITAEAAGPIPDGYRVRVPRLGIDLAVKEGDVARDIEQQRTPEGYAFHLPGTAIPGRNGNTFLYAHARAGMFLTLWDARAGDDVVIEDPTGASIMYVVRDVLPRVAPSDVSSTWPIAGEQLTLQTSTGPRPSDPRFVVIAVPKVP